MTARSSAVSRAGTNRWRPAQATGSPSGARITTPRSTPGVRDPERKASRTRWKAASRGSTAAVRPRSASRRASATAPASAPFSSEESRGSRPARTSGQQHSICCTCSTPRTSVAPRPRQATATAAAPASRRERGRRGFLTASSVTATPAAPAAHAQPSALPCSHSAAAAGVESFIILTAHGHDPPQEALSTLRTRQARVFTVDVFALDFSDDLEDADGPMHGSELDTSLLLHLAPELVRMDRAQDFVLPEKQRTRYLRTSAGSLPKRSPGSLGRPSIATPEKGERLYKMIYDRVATRVLGAPVA